jgi:hypothetical protein
MPDITLPLRTERLILRRFEGRDLDAFHAFHSLPETARFLPGPPKSYTQSMERVGKYANFEFDKEGDWVCLAIEAAGSPGLLGEVVLKWLPGSGQGEVGWTLAPGALQGPVGHGTRLRHPRAGMAGARLSLPDPLPRHQPDTSRTPEALPTHRPELRVHPASSCCGPGGGPPGHLPPETAASRFQPRRGQ